MLLLNRQLNIEFPDYIIICMHVHLIHITIPYSKVHNKQIIAQHQN